MNQKLEPLERNKKGQFIKGFSHNKGIKRSTGYKKKRSELSKGKRLGKDNPNWRNGISKDKQHYCRERRIRKLNAIGFHTLGEWETLKAQYN